MYVLDRLRSVEQGSLVVPPFHTAPCGLLPGAQVHVSVAETGEGITVLVRPYQSSQDNLMLLTAILRNEPPVEIARIMEPVSSLGINIVNAFSSVIDDLQEQHVCMVLDWSTSAEHARKRPSDPSDRRRYRDYHSVFPILVDRYVKLFEAIQRSCGAQIAKRPDGSGLPLLALEEIENPPNLLPCGTPEVERYPNGSRRFYVKIALPAFLLAKLRISLEADDDKLLRYYLLSDTRTRTLRAFFPRHSAAHDSIHLAFFHLDAPGTFATILRTVEAAGFRVLNSMVRHNKDGRNVLDAVMRVPAGMIPDNLRGQGVEVRPTESLCQWAAKTMLEHAEPRDADLFRRCSLDIGAPLYPAPRPGEWGGSVSVTGMLAEGKVRVGSKKRAAAADPAGNGNGAHAGDGSPQSSKADFVRLQVQRHHVRGVSAGELYGAFQDAGLPIQRAYLHSLLHRLREQKSIRYLDKRYFPYEEVAEEARRA